MAPKRAYSRSFELPFPDEVKQLVKQLEDAVVSAGKQCRNHSSVSVDPKKKWVTLGPCYKGEMPAEVNDVLSKHAVDESCHFSGGTWNKWSSRPQPWPTPKSEWSEWVMRVESDFGEVWKKWGIYDAIMITLNPVMCDRALLAAALCYWNTVTNTLDLRFGAMSPTLIDLAAIVGLPPHGMVIDADFGGKGPHLDLDAEALKREKRLISPKGGNPSIFAASNWIDAFAGGGKGREGEVVSSVEHAAFLAYWLSKHIICTQSGKITKEYFPIAEVLASEDMVAKGETIAFGPFVLACLYRCLNLIVCGKMDFVGGGPIWIFQLWLQAYFPEFRSPCAPFGENEILGSQLANLKPLSHTTRSCFKTLFEYPRLSSRQYSVCYGRKYPAYLGIGVNRELDENNPEEAEAAAAWKGATLTRDLYFGTVGKRAKKYGFELYYPSLFGRQLGFSQCIPCPEHASANGFSSFRAEYDDMDGVSDYRTSYVNNLKAYEWLPREKNVHPSKGFATWWEHRVRAQFSLNLADALSTALADLPWEENESVGGSLIQRCATKKTSSPRKRKRAPSPTQILLLRDVPGPRSRSITQVSSVDHQSSGGSDTPDGAMLVDEEKDTEGSSVSSPFEIQMDEEPMTGSSPDVVASKAIGLFEPVGDEVQITSVGRVDSTHVLSPAGSHDVKVGASDILPSAAQDADVPVPEHAFFEMLRVKLAEYDEEGTQAMPVQTSPHAEQMPAILSQIEEARSTVELARTRTLDEFMEPNYLTLVEGAIRMLVQNKLLSSSALTPLGELAREAGAIADYPQKEIECRLKLEALEKLEAVMTVSAVRFKEALKVAQQSSARVKACEIQLQAARDDLKTAQDELKIAGGVFLQEDEQRAAHQAELVEKRKQVESARVSLSKLVEKRSAAEAALAVFKSNLNFLG